MPDVRTTPHRWTCAAGALLSVLMPTLSMAQSASSSSNATGSGGTLTVPPEPAVIVEDRAWRLQGFTAAVVKAENADAQEREHRALYLRKRSDDRAACRDALRRSNKSTLLKTLLRCYGEELAWEKDFRRKQQDHIRSVAGITPAVRSLALSRGELLINAIDAILFAIESGVYADRDDLLEAKRNLQAKYRKPLMESLTMLRADRTLTWIADLLRQIDALALSELADARACLVAREGAFRPLIEPTTEQRSEKLLRALSETRQCIERIQLLKHGDFAGSGASAGSTASQ